MVDLTVRSQEPELMDDLDCHGQVVDQTLRELDVINKWLGGNYVTLNGLEKLLKNIPNTRNLHIIDLGSGSGEMLNLIHAWCKRRNKSCKLTGIDANPNIVRYAQNQSRQASINFHTSDVFSDDFQQLGADILVATLFLHHFDDVKLADLFRRLYRQARVGMVVNDIHRHWFSYHAIRLLTRFFSNSPMVKFDAPLSVRRAFTRPELTSILEAAGITNYTLEWKWAFRWQLIIPKTLA